MFKKIIIIIITIAVAGGISWLFINKNDQEFSSSKISKKEQNEITSILKDIENETGINFPESQISEFQWKVKGQQGMFEATVQGKMVESKNVPTNKYAGILSFFSNRNFEIDIYNISAGAIGGLMGYKKDKIVCVVSTNTQVDENGMPLDTGVRDVRIDCGKGDDSIEPFLSRDEEIKKLFAEKYATKSSAVLLDINSETANYVKGDVQILDPLIEEGMGNKGVFIANKISGNWELAEGAEKYNFSEDTEITVKKGDNFFIILEANPSTGYQWELDFSPVYINLIDRKYNIPSRQEPIVGAGGDEIFNFSALRTGEAELKASYLRLGENEEAKELIYKITIE